VSRQLVQFEGGIRLLRLNEDFGISLLFGDIAPGGSGSFDDEAEPGSIYFQTNGRLFQKRLDNTGWTKFAQELSSVINVTDEIVLTAQDILDGKVLLSQVPINASAVRLIPDGGIEQFNGIQYRVSGQHLIWEDMPLSSVVEVGTKLWAYFSYTTTNEPPAVVEVRDEVTITADHISQKKILLSELPTGPNSVRLVPFEGIEQLNGIQFRIIGQFLSWNGLGLDGHIDVGQKFFVFYTA
jgi:hypothetical protein